MKNFLVSFIFFITSLFAFSGTEKYKVNDAALDQMFGQSQDISSALVIGDISFVNFNQPSIGVDDEVQTESGYLTRWFFCGFIAMHRHYMGGDWSTLWWKYLCVPFASQVAWCGDGLLVVLKGKTILEKYKGNNKWFVWQ